jgi:propionate CoA-transferase
MLIEIAPGVSLDEDVRARIGFPVLVSPQLKTMDARLFRDEPMNMLPDFRARPRRATNSQRNLEVKAKS